MTRLTNDTPDPVSGYSVLNITQEVIFELLKERRPDNEELKECKVIGVAADMKSGIVTLLLKDPSCDNIKVLEGQEYPQKMLS